MYGYVGYLIGSVGLVLSFLGAVALVKEVRISLILAARELPEYKELLDKKLEKRHEEIRDLIGALPEVQAEFDAQKDAAKEQAIADDTRKTLRTRSVLIRQGSRLLAIGFVVQFVGLWLSVFQI